MDNNNDQAALISALDNLKKNIHKSSLDISFNELLDMKETGELNISPDYQRLFRWSEGSRSRFIESLLLEMPIPPIYVVEEEENKYLLIDGLQRISSYLHLRGKLDAQHLDPPVKLEDKLVLTECDIVRELNGKTWEDLGTALQIKLKRAFVRVEVIRKGSNAHFKYHMFKRLNTGGEVLSEQQIRNCTIRLLDPTFNDFINKLSGDESFKICTENLTYKQILEAFNQELVLRFFAFKNNKAAFKHDVGDFLTDYMEAVSDPTIKMEFNYQEEEKVFRKTFKVLANSLGELSFGYASKNKNIVRGFGIYQYEAITLGLQPYIQNLNPEDGAQMKILADILVSVKLHDDFIKQTTGGGKNSPGLLNDRILFVEKAIAQSLK